MKKTTPTMTKAGANAGSDIHKPTSVARLEIAGGFGPRPSSLDKKSISTVGHRSPWTSATLPSTPPFRQHPRGRRDSIFSDAYVLSPYFVKTKHTGTVGTGFLEESNLAVHRWCESFRSSAAVVADSLSVAARSIFVTATNLSSVQGDSAPSPKSHRQRMHFGASRR